ncbi:hypothetical protein [Nocardia sp. GTS18]|uniref:hypothetical protein n=1 Tax=Nocardia sp. GTS18 TaxID=1778064 RepID=UPI0015EE57DD|nr:hypothetical protein [Nocardia sp. GTS18]
MFLKKIAVPVALSLSALAVTAAGAQAEPAAPRPVEYTAHTDGTTSVIEIEHGSLVVDNGTLQVRDAAGTVVGATPLTFAVDDFQFPIDARVEGATATLTPVLSMDKAVYKPVALPFEDKAPWKSEYDREQAAWSRMTSTISMGATIGTLVGGIGGAALGCLAGAAAGVVLTGALLTLFGAGPLAGCVAGAAAVGFLGVLAGQIFVTAPVAIGAVIQYVTTINQPFTAPAK